MAAVGGSLSCTTASLFEARVESSGIGANPSEQLSNHRLCISGSFRAMRAMLEGLTSRRLPAAIQGGVMLRRGNGAVQERSLVSTMCDRAASELVSDDVSSGRSAS